MNSPEKKKNNLKKSIRRFQYIWATIVLIYAGGGIFIHFGIAADTEPADFTEYYLLSYISYLLLIMALPGGYYLFDRTIKRAAKSNTSNIVIYRNALSLKHGVFGAAGLFSLLTYAITCKPESMYASAIVLIAFLINMPSKHSYKRNFESHTLLENKISKEEIEDFKETLKQNKNNP